MSASVSVATMVKQIAGLAGTTDVNAWENGFIANVVETTRDGADTRALTDNQLEKIEQIWRKHFA